MKLSVIICTLNRVDDLKITLESLAAQSVKPDQLLIIDQSDNQETKRLLAKFKGTFSCKYFFQKKKSLTTARNKGIRLASGEIIVFLDDDVTLHKDYLKNCLKTFTDENVVAVHGFVENYFAGPKVFFLVNKYYNYLFGNDFLSVYSCGVRGVFGNTYPLFKPKKKIMCSSISGCNFAFRRKLIQKNNLFFDEQLIRYSFKEDADWGYRVFKSGIGKIILNPEMILIHRVSPEARVTPAQKVTMKYVYFSYLFFKNVSINKFYYFWSFLGDQIKRNFFFLFTLNFISIKRNWKAISFLRKHKKDVEQLNLKKINEELLS